MKKDKAHHVLIIDDDPRLKDDFEAFLESRGFVAISADHGEEGLQLLDQYTFDIVLLALDLPSISGSKILETLNQKYPELPIIVLSMETNPQDIIYSFRNGAWDYFVKPVNEYEKLFNLMENIFKKSARIEQDKEYESNLENIVFQRTMELEKTNRALTIAKEKAEDSDRLKTSFMSSISHELRTPMNVVIGFTEELAQSNLDSEQTEYVSIIRKRGNDLLNLINDVIDVTQAMSGRMQVRNTAFKLNEMLEDVYISLNRSKPPSITFTFQPPSEKQKLTIVSDKGCLRQVVNNLLLNAFKFTKEGGVSFGYEVREDGFLEFFVKDSGIGIPENVRDMIFDSFRQAEEGYSRSFGGLGLGLPLTKKLVELMEGNIHFISQEGEGTTFYFVIPLNEEIEGHKKSDNNNKIVWSEKTILVVEDDMFNFVFFEKILKKTGCKIIHSKDGIEAVSECKNNSDIDIVLMDIQMPRLDGYQATKQIKAFRNKLPIIAQTAHAFSDEKEKVFESGCDDFVAKPIDVSLLLDKMSQLLK